MDKAHILSEIRRTATANGGAPLGWRRFSLETGIKSSEWNGVFWARWGDALIEAGYAPNEFNEAIPTSELLEKYASLAVEIGHLPTQADIRLKGRTDLNFPNDVTFTRLGSKAELVKQLADYCRPKPDFEAVVRWCEAYKPQKAPHRLTRGVSSVTSTSSSQASSTRSG